LNEEQRAFVFRDSALDFGVYSRVTKRLLLAIEVDGWEFHGMSEEQQRRDALKDSIMNVYGIPVLRLPTIGSGEDQKIREALDRFL
jgi:very-short-patch-repair endonuclease